MSKILLLGDTHTALFPTKILGTEEDEIINLGIKNIEYDQYREFIFKNVFNNINNTDYIIFQIGLSTILKNKKINLKVLVDKIRMDLLKINKLDLILIVQPIYPTQNKELNEIIEEFNFLLAQECYGMGIEFLDIFELLLGSDDLLKETYVKNDTYLNNKGYDLIANQINDYIETLNNNYMR